MATTKHDRTHVPNYLLSDLDVADRLPELLGDVPLDVVESLQARLRKLVALVTDRDRRIQKMEHYGVTGDVRR